MKWAGLAFRHLLLAQVAADLAALPSELLEFPLTYPVVNCLVAYFDVVLFQKKLLNIDQIHSTLYIVFH